jgi:hypothetical protein
MRMPAAVHVPLPRVPPLEGPRCLTFFYRYVPSMAVMDPSKTCMQCTSCTPYSVHIRRWGRNKRMRTVLAEASCSWHLAVDRVRPFKCDQNAFLCGPMHALSLLEKRDESVQADLSRCMYPGQGLGIVVSPVPMLESGLGPILI